jgi:acyl-coenzyme A synthetase/AMP-(fatty) acid ligase
VKSLAEELSAGMGHATLTSPRGTRTGQQVLAAAARLAAWLDSLPSAPLVSCVADAASTAVTVLAGDIASRPVVHLDPIARAPFAGGVTVCESPVEPAGYADQAVGLFGSFTPFTECLSGVPERSHLFFTSGSTGVPSGVVRSAASVVADARRVTDVLRLGTERNIVVSAPVYHVYGFNYGLIAPLLAGAAVYYAGPRLIPSQLERAIARHQADTLIGHPALFRLVAADTRPVVSAEARTLRRAVSAGAPLPSGGANAFIQRYRAELFNCYGSSEAGAVTLSPVTGGEAAGDAGLLLTGIDARISDGELQLRTSSLAAGYLSAAGLATLELDGDWYRTGDLAELAGRSVGLHGRLADVINVAGKKVDPAEIETVLLSHPAVTDVEVSAQADSARGSIPVAVVALNCDTAVTELVSWCRVRLDPHKVPRRIEVREAIPRTVTGKRLRPAREPQS